MQSHEIKLSDMKNDKEGIIKEIIGGQDAVHRLAVLGLRKGVTIKKVSGMFMKGPITVKIGSNQISLGHGIASKVIIGVNK